MNHLDNFSLSQSCEYMLIQAGQVKGSNLAQRHARMVPVTWGEVVGYSEYLGLLNQL